MCYQHLQVRAIADFSWLVEHLQHGEQLIPLRLVHSASDHCPLITPEEPNTGSGCENPRKNKATADPENLQLTIGFKPRPGLAHKNAIRLREKSRFHLYCVMSHFVEQPITVLRVLDTCQNILGLVLSFSNRWLMFTGSSLW